MGRHPKYTPVKKRLSPAQREHLHHLNTLGKENKPLNDASMLQVIPSLPRNPSKRAKVLAERLVSTNHDLVRTRHELGQVTRHLTQEKGKVTHLEVKARDWQRQLHNESKKLKRAKDAVHQAKLQVSGLQTDMKAKSDQLEAARMTYMSTLTQLNVLKERLGQAANPQPVAQGHDELERIRGQLRASRAKVRALEMRCRRRAERDLKKILAKRDRDKGPSWRLFRKNVYSSQARGLARFLVQAGCSQQSVGRVIQRISKLMGFQSERVMSSRTVARAITEGGIATRIQLGYEISKAKGITVSGDGTTHRKLNYESRMIGLTLPADSVGSENSDKQFSHCSRFFSVSTAVDHTSDTQLNDWRKELENLTETFQASPFARRQGICLDVNVFLKKLKGMHSDHASDQKKTFRLWREWRLHAITASYGFERIAYMREHSSDQLNILLLFATARLVEAIGGDVEWSQLDEEARRPHLSKMMEDMALTLGAEVVASLPPEERRTVELFFWAGCSMHKELNSVKGGNTAMMAWWGKNGVTPPILLANKDNDATIKLAEIVDGSDAAVKRALEMSSRGGVKASSLAGSLFNHKDDKKGQQDMHLLFFQDIKGALPRFPDTSNTRYQSYCDGATELIKHLAEYLHLIEFIQFNKENMQLNHMEENLRRALLDPPTRTELAVLTIYGQTVTKPYMWCVRAPGTENLNILTLGPLHEELKGYIQTVISNPSCILVHISPGDHEVTPSFGGKPWDDPIAVDVIIAMHTNKQLPHFLDVLVAFFTGALATWQKFTSEYESGGLIATSTEAEREVAFMPTTNDENEGNLGMWRRHSRCKPSLAVSRFSDQVAFFRNDTEAFMETSFTDEDHTHLRNTARQVDASGIERERRKELIQHATATAKLAKEKAERKVQRQTARDEHFSAITIVTDRKALEAMVIRDLDDQLELHRRLAKDSAVPLKSHLKTRQTKLDALVAAVEQYERRSEIVEATPGGSGAQMVKQAVARCDAQDSDDE